MVPAFMYDHTSSSPQTTLVVLDRDHPGFRDAAYRARRHAIARVALEYRGGPVPAVEYTDAEQEVWRTVWRHLAPLHAELAAAEYRQWSAALPLDRTRIPQLAQLNPHLAQATGFAMTPVAGLVAARDFLGELADHRFLSTQYIRHHSAPLYTPEPDIVHELVGHAASLANPDIAALSRAFGRAARAGDDAAVARLERVYWYTLEFGVVRQGNEVTAIGAGILSSFGEMQRFRGAVHREWDIQAMAATDYDPTDYQPFYFVAPSFARMVDDLRTWCESGAPPQR